MRVYTNCAAAGARLRRRMPISLKHQRNGQQRECLGVQFRPLTEEGEIGPNTGVEPPMVRPVGAGLARPASPKASYRDTLQSLCRRSTWPRLGPWVEVRGARSNGIASLFAAAPGPSQKCLQLTLRKATLKFQSAAAREKQGASLTAPKVPSHQFAQLRLSTRSAPRPRLCFIYSNHPRFSQSRIPQT